MRKQFLLITVLSYFLICFSFCKKKTDEIPVDVLKQKEMIAVLTDVQVAEAALSQRAMNANAGGQSYTSAYYKYIFTKYKITPDQFKRSMEWYSRHPEVLDKIYEQVINHLSKKQSEVTNK